MPYCTQDTGITYVNLYQDVGSNCYTNLKWPLHIAGADPGFRKGGSKAIASFPDN